MLNDLDNTWAIVVAALLVGAVLWDIGRDVRRLVSARNASLVTLATWFLFEAVKVPEDLRKFTQGEYDYAVLCVGLSLGAFLVGYGVMSGRVFDGLGRRLPGLDSPGLLWKVFLVAFAIGMLPLVVLSGIDLWLIVQSAIKTGGRWSGAFGRGRYGGLRDAFLELQMFLNAAVPLAAIIALDRRAAGLRRVVCAAFLAWMAARVLTDGTRSKVLPILLPIAAVIYWKMRASQQRWSLLVGVPVVCVVGYVWSAATVATRNEGGFAWEAAEDVEYTGIEMFRELVFLSSNVPEPIPYEWGKTYFVQVVNPIPRFLWPGKPVGDAGLLLARAYGAVDPVTGEPTMTVSPGLIGEMYFNFGVLGVIVLSGLWGWLARAWDRLPAICGRSTMGFVIYAAGLAIIFISGRSFSVPALYGMLSFTVLVYLLCPERRVSSAGVRVAGAGLGCDAVVRTPARAHLEMAGASAK